MVILVFVQGILPLMIKKKKIDLLVKIFLSLILEIQEVIMSCWENLLSLREEYNHIKVQRGTKIQ